MADEIPHEATDNVAEALPRTDHAMTDKPRTPNGATPPAKPSKNLARVMQNELRKAGIDANVSDGGKWFAFASADDLLAFVGAATSTPDQELNWDVLNNHPVITIPRWDYMVHPYELPLELVETSKGKRWCRELTLHYNLSIPEEHVPEIIGILRDLNARAKNREEAQIPLPEQPVQSASSSRNVADPTGDQHQ